MSKEQKTLKSCYILDRLREWFELYGNQNHQRAEEELHLAIDELYEYQQKDRQIADLEARLAESEKDKQFYFFENGEKGLKIRGLKQQVNDWKQRFESSEERNKQMADNGVKALELKNEKIKELKQQLAEKDEQIESYKQMLQMLE